MGKSEYDGSERRNYYRVVYGPGKRPLLSVGDMEFEILDITEGGIRFLGGQDMNLPPSFEGTIAFLSGAALRIKGRIEWIQNGETGISLYKHLPSAIIQKERQYTILDLE